MLAPYFPPNEWFHPKLSPSSPSYQSLPKPFLFFQKALCQSFLKATPCPSPHLTRCQSMLPPVLESSKLLDPPWFVQAVPSLSVLLLVLVF